RYSNIELGVFWHQAPTDNDRQQAAERINGDLLRLYPYEPAEEVWCDDFMLGRAHPDQPRSGVLVEVLHYTTDFLQRTFDGIPVHNAELVAQWKTRAAQYPDEIAIAVINRYA
ncbi:MAG: hypothetical protein AAGF95_30430, partial [Chloroflexota bacterium]